MVKDAESHAEEDKRQKDEVEARNQTDSLVYSTEQTLAELGDKVPADMKSNAEAAIQKGKDALAGTDIEAVRAAAEELRQVGYKLAEVVYSDAQASGAAAGSAQGADDVVDAEYEVVDDSKKEN
jgi:molecular chaperone DnaK